MTTFSPMAALSDSIRPLRPAGYIREPVAPRAPPRPVRLLDRVRFVFRLRHDNRPTEEAYVGWIRRFILFHGKRHPAEMAAPDVTAFLSSLAVRDRVSASTQNQALSALLFLYREVLYRKLPWLDDVVRARRPRRLPVVLSREEVRTVLDHLFGAPRLVATLLYGLGLRLLESLRLRVKDVDFAAGHIVVRAGKSDRDRVTLLPSAAGGRSLETSGEGAPAARPRSGSRRRMGGIADRAGTEIPERRAGMGMAAGISCGKAS